MKLELPVKIKIHTHVSVETPFGDADADLVVHDPDGDGQPNYRLKWDLPGKGLDSGPDGLQGEVPLMSLVAPLMSGVLMAAEAVGAPAAVVSILRSLTD